MKHLATNQINSMPGLFAPPIGVVLDDDPDPLLGSIKAWMEANLPNGCVPVLIKVKSARSRNLIVRWIDKADFVFVDLRLNGKFADFDDGIELATFIAERRPSLPIFFYTGFPDDLFEERSRKGRKKLRIEARRLLRLPQVIRYDKSELHAEDKLDKLVADFSSIMGGILVRRYDKADPDLQRAIGATVVATQDHNYRVTSQHPDGSFTLEDLDDPYAVGLQVPERQIGKVSAGDEIALRVYELSSGQILSSFVAVPFGIGSVAPEVQALIKRKASQP